LKILEDDLFKSGTKVEFKIAHSLANFASQKADLQKLQLGINRFVFDSKPVV